MWEKTEGKNGDLKFEYLYGEGPIKIEALIKLEDELDFNPRENDNKGKMITWHKRYSLGDEHYKSPFEMPITTVLNSISHEAITEGFLDTAFDESSLIQLSRIDNLTPFKGKVIIFPLYLMDHSGLAISVVDFEDPFDSGFLGIYYHVLKGEEDAEAVKKEMLAEIEIYNSYLGGEIWKCQVTVSKACKCCGNFGTHEEVDSCSGFIGSLFKDECGIFQAIREYVECFTPDCGISQEFIEFCKENNYWSR